MSFRDEVVEFEEDFIDFWTDPEVIWKGYTLLPGIGPLLSVGRAGYEWAEYGTEITQRDLFNFGMLYGAREVLYYGAYRSSMNISSLPYLQWKHRLSIGLGQTAGHAAKGLWRIKGAIGWGLAITAAGWAMTSGIQMLSDAIFGGHTDQGESSWIPPLHKW